MAKQYGEGYPLKPNDMMRNSLAIRRFDVYQDKLGAKSCRDLALVVDLRAQLF
jgi:hypothetical protein